MRNLVILLFLIVGVACNTTVEDIVEQYDNGQIKTIRKYDGKIDDKQLIEELQFYPDGSPAYVKTFKYGKPHGNWKFWHSNGNTWSIGEYKNGERVGESMVYHENGQLFFKGLYIDGFKHGTWIFYNENGTIESKHEFDMGKEINPKRNLQNNTNKEE